MHRQSIIYELVFAVFLPERLVVLAVVVVAVDVTVVKADR